MLESLKSNLKDPGFWASVVIVNLVVAAALTLVRAPGFKS